jgi:hypothetical protein
MFLVPYYKLYKNIEKNFTIVAYASNYPKNLKTNDRIKISTLRYPLEY